MHHGTCVTHVPWCMSGSLACSDGENVPGIPGACAPAILRIWQEAHELIMRYGALRWVIMASLLLKLCISIFIFDSNFRTEGSLSECLFDSSHSVFNFEGVDVVKLRLAQCDKSYNGLKQRDSATECPLLLMNIFDEGSLPHSASNDNFTTTYSYDDSLISYFASCRNTFVAAIHVDHLHLDWSSLLID